MLSSTARVLMSEWRWHSIEGWKGCLVNDPQLETGGLPFGLHLDSAATRYTCKGLPLWLHSPMHQGGD